MVAYDAVETCELVEIFMSSLLSKRYNSNNIGLYHEHGSLVFKNSRQQRKIQKKKLKFFKDKGLQIIIKCNLKI